MTATYQSQMIKSKARLRPWIYESLFTFIIIIGQPGGFADDALRNCFGPSPRMKVKSQRFTRWSCPGDPTVMNCSKLYSRRAGCTPTCSSSSRLMILRTSNYWRISIDDWMNGARQTIQNVVNLSGGCLQKKTGRYLNPLRCVHRSVTVYLRSALWDK
jgi:hypothetical protein